MSDVGVDIVNAKLKIPVKGAGQQRLFSPSALRTAIGGKLSVEKGNVAVQALDGVSFSLRPGEHLGLMGHNGAGKTTLLRLLAGIYPATSGTVSIRGDVGCLINMSLGMSEDMTAIACVKYFANFVASRRLDWQDLLEDIAEFTELGDFMNMPLRTYSAGMRTRLIAGLVTADRHDVLIMDEAIGAGDAAFQSRFQKRLTGFLDDAKILILASHSVELLRQYCTVGMVLSHGKMEFVGPINEAIDRHFGEYVYLNDEPKDL